jgi:ABC-type amino acid transport substrate-binding protein
MNWNKLLKLTASAFLVTSLTACASGKAASTAASGSDTGEAKTQNIIIGISPDYPPFDSLDESGNLTGFDYDMGEWIFNWFDENGYNYTHEWKQMSFDTIITSIQAGQVDLGISGFTYDKDRKVEFSDSYYKSAQVALVNADSDLKSTDDLTGKHLAAQLGATGEGCAKEIDENAESLEDMGVAIQMLKAGNVDAVILDTAVADNYEATGDYKVLEGNLLDEDTHIIAKEGNTELMDDVNKALAAFLESDDYQKLLDQYGIEQ